MDENLRKRILDLVDQLAISEHSLPPFKPGQTQIPISGKVYGSQELRFLVDASMDFWLTAGRYNDEFEKRLASFLKTPHILTTNSGSSANLLAISALTSPELGNRALRSGDEVITVAAGFPTTVNPILQNGLTPVFLDIQLPTYNVDPTLLEAALTEKTRAIILAHTLGNPFDIEKVTQFAKEHNLWLVEDCCDALGSTYRGRMVGGFGDIGTLSFYPAHHITMGEGGAVFTNNGLLKRIIESFRDWGRDCFCPTGKDNTCGKRFDWQLGDLPYGYDHKYTYSHAGYNLKITDMQAAIGLAQLDRLTEFINSRRKNFKYLKKHLAPFEEIFILPEATPASNPSWFGFPLTLRKEAPFSRVDLLRHLDENKICSRLLFGGNLTRQPYFKNKHHRIVASLKNTDLVMDNTFWLGTFPGLNESMLNYVVEQIKKFLDKQL